MAFLDSSSSIPVRTQTNGDVVAFLADGTTPTQLLSIDASGRLTMKLDDGNGNLITSQTNGTQRALDVGLNVGGVQIDPRQIRALTATDVVTVQQGTTPWVTKDQADGPVTPGTAASFSELIGGQYNSTLPTLTTGQQAAIQVNANGVLLVAQSSTPWNTKDSSDGSITGGATGTTAMLGGGVFTTSTGLSTPLTAGNMAALQFDANGRLLTNVVTPLPTGTNTIGAVNQGTSPWVTSDLADGSATGGTAGTKSLLAGGVYNSSLPTLTTGQQVGLQTDTNGRLLVGSIASALPAGTNLLGGTTVYVGASQASVSNPLPVVLSNTTPGTPVYYFNATAGIASGGTDSSSVYTITATKTFNIKKIFVGSSQHMRVDFLISANGTTFTNIFSGFVPFGGGNCDFSTDIFSIVDSGTGSAVKVVLTNEDKGTASGYVTILGTEN